MNLGEYLRDRAPVLLLNAAALLVLSVFLLLTGNTETAVFLIVFVWISVAAVWFLTDWFFRRRYFRELMSVLNDLDRRYLISEVIEAVPQNGRPAVLGDTQKIKPLRDREDPGAGGRPAGI